jgi:hypothetical protein
MNSSEADAVGARGLLNLESTTAAEFLQLIFGMLEATGLDGTGTVIEFEDIDGLAKSVWIEIWNDDLEIQ